MYPGTDLIEIDRVAKALERRPSLKAKLFTAAEIAECAAKGFPAASFAGRFAAKEAISKALGSGLHGLQWTEIEVLNGPLGKPEVRLFGAAAELARRLKIREVRISISHSREMALAFAIALKEEN